MNQYYNDKKFNEAQRNYDSQLPDDYWKVEPEERAEPDLEGYEDDDEEFGKEFE